MNKTIQREVRFDASRDQVCARSPIARRWPNGCSPTTSSLRVGHAFTFQVPPKPAMKFDGLTVRCEVLECDPPRDQSGDAGGRLVFTWTAGGPVTDTRVSFTLLPDGAGTRLLFEHAGFDFTQPYADQAFQGATYGWAGMLEKLQDVVARGGTP
ncbi:MAG: SRPBCC domain-containing protein [Pirellulales bacterium]